jgi:hypothetical protein
MDNPWFSANPLTKTYKGITKRMKLAEKKIAGLMMQTGADHHQAEIR